MDIQPVAPGGSSGNSGGTLSTETVTQDEFLRLLVVQLENQDPLNPMESQDFLAQLATLNSLDQLIGINRKLESMRSEQGFLSQLEATSLIGKRVTAEGNHVSLVEGGGADVHYNLPADASRVVVNITDTNGNLVRSLEVGSQARGNQTVLWDGRDSQGNPVNPGVYNSEVDAFNLSGVQVPALTRIQGVVTGVDLSGSVPVLEISGLEVPINAVIRVEGNAQAANNAEEDDPIDNSD